MASADESRSRALRLCERLTIATDEAEIGRIVEGLASAERPCVVSFLNAHAMNIAWRDRAFFDALMAADLLLRDGSGMRLLCRALGWPPGLNLNGTDLIPRILERFRGRPLALCGTEEPYLSRAAARLEGVVAKIDGFEPPGGYVEPIRASGAKVVLLGMGMPKQELVARRLQGALEAGVVIINGGAILDFMAGRFARAPDWMRAAGMEWSFRLAQEPRRLFSRYVLGNALFLARVARLRRSARFDVPPGTA